MCFKNNFYTGVLHNFSNVVSFYNQSVNQQITYIPHIDNEVGLQHIQEELMWDRRKLKCRGHICIVPFLRQQMIIVYR